MVCGVKSLETMHLRSIPLTVLRIADASRTRVTLFDCSPATKGRCPEPMDSSRHGVYSVHGKWETSDALTENKRVIW